MNLDLFDNTGIIAGLNGMKAAIDHADRVEPDWSDIAFDALAAVFRNSPCPLTIEQARSRVRLQSPTDERAWGAVVRRLSSRGVIVRTGEVAPAESSHGSYKPKWRAV